MSTLRLLALVAGSFVAALLAAGAARADEAIVLDNGAVLRGSVVQEDASVVTFRLSGLGTESRIEIRRDRIRKRFSTDALGRYDPDAYFGASALPASTGEPPAKSAAPDARHALATEPSLEPIPEEEPQADEEGFMRRLVRLAVVAFPTEPFSRTFLATLAFVVLLCLVGIGARMAEVEGVTLAKVTGLALGFAGLVAMDTMWYATFLRADRATWVLPVQLMSWVGATAIVLRCGLGRAVLLMGFVLFAGALAAFASGAVLVAV